MDRLLVAVLERALRVTTGERLGPIVVNYRRFFGDTANVIIDAGTRDGQDADYLARELNASRVVAIDANPLAVAKTKQNFPHFEVIETALANYVGKSTFDQIVSDREDYAGSSSLTQASKFSDAEHNLITVKVNTMSNVLAEIQLDGLLDVIKVDLEGYTYEFLQGLHVRLADVKLLHLETETFTRHEGHRNNEDVIRLMTTQGFQLVDKSYEWGPAIEDQVWVNTALALD